MMIGGLTLPVSGAASEGDIDILSRAARAAWPSGVIEGGDGQLVMSLRQAVHQRKKLPSDLFIYENQAAFESWTEYGLTDDNADQMLSVVIEPSAVVFMVNEEGSKTFDLARQLILSLLLNRAAFGLLAA